MSQKLQPLFDSKEFIRLKYQRSKSSNSKQKLHGKNQMVLNNSVQNKLPYRDSSVEDLCFLNIKDYKGFVRTNQQRINRRILNSKNASNESKITSIQRSQIRQKSPDNGKNSTFSQSSSNPNNRFMNASKTIISDFGQIQVYKFEVENEPRPFMMKVIQVDDKHLWKELYFLQQLKHPNIIQLMHHFISQDNNQKTQHMIFPWVSCSIARLMEQVPHRQFIEQNHWIGPKPIPHLVTQSQKPPVPYQTIEKKGKVLSRVLLKVIIYQIVRGLAYLHSKLIILRDLNPYHIGIDLDTFDVMIMDVSHAKQYIEGENLSSNIGDPSYRAPELLLGSSEYNIKADLWSLGCLIIEVYYGIKMFQGKSSVEVFANVIKVLGTPTNEELVKMKSPIKQLKMPRVSSMGIQMQFQHYKNNDGLPDLLERLLVYAPEQRTTAFELLLHPFFAEIKHPQIRVNQKSIPNIFNFTKEELNLPLYSDNLYRLVPEWFKEQQKRDAYLKTNYEDALLLLKV